MKIYFEGAVLGMLTLISAPLWFLLGYFGAPLPFIVFAFISALLVGAFGCWWKELELKQGET